MAANKPKTDFSNIRNYRKQLGENCLISGKGLG